MAKTIGSFAIVNNISGVTKFAIESPINTSASFIASAKVEISLSVANSAFCEVKLSRSLRMTPLLSVITIFLDCAPKDLYNLVHETAAAPAPLTTIFTSSSFLPTSSQAFNNAAAEIIAVPC